MLYNFGEDKNKESCFTMSERNDSSSTYKNSGVVSDDRNALWVVVVIHWACMSTYGVPATPYVDPLVTSNDKIVTDIIPTYQDQQK